MVCGGLRWFSRFLTAHGHTDVLSSQILVVVCGGLRWCVVVCGGLWWFAVVCGGLWWIAVGVFIDRLRKTFAGTKSALVIG